MNNESTSRNIVIRCQWV